ncbi:MAG: histone deacetylase [Candidatus Nezhaarchaeales archaeon]
MLTGVFYSEECLKHETGLKHPERAARLTRVIGELLGRKELLETGLKVLTPLNADLAPVRRVHSDEYVDTVLSISKREGGGYIAPDTPISEGSLRAALAAIGAALTAASYIGKGDIRNAFCLIRPPGHHASRGRGGGFCVFNNAAILSSYLIEVGARRILILDWDAHHGNGTQEIFYGSSKVLYFSIHQEGLYPYTGFIEEVGVGEGEGFNVNMPLPPTAGDREVLNVIDEVFNPLVALFKPDWMVVSAGFDAHHADPLGGLRLTVNGYYKIAKRVREEAEEVCGGRLIALLEGGYNLKHLPGCVLNAIAAFSGLPPLYFERLIPSSVKVRRHVDYRIKRLKRILSSYWKF